MKINNIFNLIIAVAVCELAGILGSLFTMPSILTWYATLPKPALNPPAWVFAPVWTILFALMGISLYLIWREKQKGESRIAVLVFFQQLSLNVLWSALFFEMHNPMLAFAEIIVLWMSILMTIFYFAKISKPAAWLLAPYILWVSFAGYLNYAIWQISTSAPAQVACTMEAKLCPDGSAVGRVGPNCEFAQCPALKSNDYKNISYLIEGQAIKLQNGVAETEIITGGASKTITQYFGNEIRADFNGDGLEDIAFLLTQNSGGSGTFFYIVAALKAVDGYQGTNGILLGDRIAHQTTEFQNGKIIVNYAQRKLNEPMTATPSVGVSKYLKVNENRLIEVEK